MMFHRRTENMIFLTFDNLILSTDAHEKDRFSTIRRRFLH